MPERTFFQETARAQVTAAIKEIEAQTSAEIVVAVRGTSGSYRDIDYLVGFAVSVGALVYLLFDPFEFALEGMPLEVIVAFIFGALVSAQTRPLRRALTPAKRLDANALVAARAAFVELGVGRTRERDGIFVLVSLFERRVKLVADIGIDAVKLGPDWFPRVAALESSLRHGANIDAFLTALRALGPVLAAGMPHRPEDVNELSDEVAE